MAEYKYKPYVPKNLPFKSKKIMDEVEKTKASLESQKANLEQRLLSEGIDPETLGGEFDNRNVLEKALNLTPDQGLLMDFFEVINRPVEAVKSAIVAGMDGDNFLKGAWDGISGNKVTKGSEVLETFGIDTDDNLIANIATDIVLDPLTYVPSGILLKAGKKLFTRTIDDVVRNADVLMTQTLRNASRKIPIMEGEDALSYLARLAADNEVDFVFRSGDIGDYSQRALRPKEQKGLYKKGVQGLKERAQSLIDVKVEIDRLRKTNPNISNEDILKVLKKDPKYKATVYDWNRINEANLTEMEIYKKYADLIESADPKDIRVVRTSSESNRLDDVIVLKRYRDSEYFVKVEGIEAKMFGGAEGTTMMPRFDDNGKIVNAAGGFQFSDKLLQRFDKFLLNELDGIPLKNRLDDLRKTGKTTSSKTGKQIQSLDIADLIKNSPELQSEYKNIVFDMMREKGITLISFADPVKGGVFTMSLDAAKKHTKIMSGFQFSSSSSSASVESLKKWYKQKLDFLLDSTKKAPRKNAVRESFLSEFMQTAGEDFLKLSVDEQAQAVAEALFQSRKQLRFKPRLMFDDASLDAAKAAGDLLEDDEVVRQLVGETKIKRQVGILEYLGKTRNDRLGQIAASFDSFLQKFKSAFNLTFGFSSAEAEKMKQLIGESMFDLERRSARLAAIKEELIKIDPKAGELLGELVESGAYIDGSGRIVTIKRRIGTSDFLDYANNRLLEESPIVLPRFYSEADKANFTKQLNDIANANFSTSNKTEWFKIVERNGGTVLEFDGTLDDMKDIINYFNDKSLVRPDQLRNAYLSFGKPNLSKEAKNLLRQGGDNIKEYQRLSDEILRELVDKAGFENLPKALSEQIGYMRHIITKEAYEGLQKTMPLVRSRFSKIGRDTLSQRTFLGSAQEVNAALREFSGLEVNLFDPDAFNSMEDLIKVAQRKMEQHDMLNLILTGASRDNKPLFRVIKNEAKAKLGPLEKPFKNFTDEFNALYENLSPNSRKALDGFLKLQGLGKDTMLVMNESAFNVLKNVQKAYVDLKPLVRMYDKFLNTWKGLTLVTPGFHMRNLFGNSFNSYVAGMDMVAQGRYAAIASRELSQFTEIGKKLAKGLELTVEEQELFELVRGYFSRGVSQTHRGIRDLEQLKEGLDAATTGAGKLKTTYNNLLRFNFNAAEKMDDFQRYMLYRWSLDKTGDAAMAARKVREALFDYSHLTPFEKDYMKRLFPFYTFMKNNFIFQAKTILKNPGAYARVGRAYNYAIEDLSGYTQENMPDYITENMWLPIPMTLNRDDKEAITFLKANLPLSDFTELVENPFKKGVISLTAPVKLLIEFGAGRDMFTGAPLQNFPGETSALEKGTGVLSGVRDSRGNLTISQSPLFQKILQDIGFRTPINLASVPLDLVDTLAGYQGGSEGLGDFLTRMGVVGVQKYDNIELTALYQDLEKLRNLKKYYEQETGNQLPLLPRG